MLFSGLSFINGQDTINVCYDITNGEILSTETPATLTCNSQVGGFYTMWSVIDGQAFTPNFASIDDTITVVKVYCTGATNPGDPFVSAYIRKIAKPKICLITGDPVSGGLIIAVDSTTMVGYDTAYVQKETAGVFNTIGTIVKQNNLTFIDSLSDFTSQAFTYQLTSIYCGASDSHTSIHLQTTGRNLNWSTYVGLTNLSGFYIWRKNPSDIAWVQIGTTSNTNTTSYTDNSLTYQDSAVFLVEAIKPDGCNTNVWKTNETVFASGSIRSNIALSTLTGIAEPKLESKITFTNPSDGLHLTSETAVDIIVTSLSTGQVINYTPHVSNLNLDLVPGIYSVDVRSGNDRMIKKLVVIN